MEIVSEGSLESISRPASTSKRSSSRSSGRSVSSSVQHSLDILPPEEPTLTCSSNFEVEEDIIVTDITEDVNSDEESNEDLSQAKDEQAINKITKYLLSFDKAAVSAKAEQQVQPNNSLSTKQERIENSAENEPNKTDLSIQDGRRSAESESSSTTGSHDNDDLDPKIRKGMERIKKLDNILIEKVKREKEVKKQRLEQERLWREHLEMLERCRDAGLGKPVDLGPAHMLALGAPQDTEDSVSEDSAPVTPLFATQPLVDEERLLRQRRHEETAFETREHSIEGDKMSASESKNKTNQGVDKDVKRNNKKNKKDRKVKKKDFIKRNILLAADASNVVAMTEEEKKRLEEILSDMGDLMEEPVDKESLILYGNGFVPSQEEVQQLADIETRLQSLMPFEEYEALCEETVHDRDTQSLQSETPRSENETLSFLSDEEMPTFGELVLQEKKEMREMKQRLMTIEEQLQRFQNDDHDDGILSDSLLRQLLDDNSRTTSQATTILDRISSTSMSCDTTSSFDQSSVIVGSSVSSMAEQ